MFHFARGLAIEDRFAYHGDHLFPWVFLGVLARIPSSLYPILSEQ